MIKMIATRSFRYGGKILQKGETFEARDKTHARQLRGAAFAADAVRRGRPPKIETEVAVPEAVVAAESVMSTGAETQSKRKYNKADTYQTRVLSAED